MYVRPLFIDNSSIFIYKKRNFAPINNFRSNTGGPAYSICLKKKEKRHIQYPCTGPSPHRGLF